MEGETGYRAYLLRLWRPSRQAGCAWRASLQPPLAEGRIGFADLAELVAFLRAEMQRADAESLSAAPAAPGEEGEP